jgi:hypothetical protein
MVSKNNKGDNMEQLMRENLKQTKREIRIAEQKSFLTRTHQGVIDAHEELKRLHTQLADDLVNLKGVLNDQR